MKILLVLILLALVVLSTKKDKIPGYKPLSIFLVLLGMVCATTQWGSDEEKYDEAEDTTVGRVIGEQMAKELEPGGVVLVIDTAHVPGKSPRVDARYEGLTAGWGDVSFQSVRIDPKNLVDSSQDETMISEAVYALYEGYMEAGPFLQVLKNHPDADAVVSFVGLPYNISKKAMSKLPRMYLGNRSALKVSSEKLIRMNNIQMILEIRSADSPAPEAADAKRLPEVFTQRYRILRSAG